MKIIFLIIEIDNQIKVELKKADHILISIPPTKEC